MITSPQEIMRWGAIPSVVATRCGHRRAGRARNAWLECGRPCGVLVPGGMWTVPVVCERPAEPLRSRCSIMTGTRPDDPSSFRLSLDGAPVAQTCGLSTFSEYTTVSVDSAIKVDKDLPLDKLCLLGCGVGTGWGAAVNSAEVYPGQTIIVQGIGGIGINAVQGAVHAGAARIIAVDPVPFKRESALKFGATHAVSDMAEATEIARSFTNGQGADARSSLWASRPGNTSQRPSRRSARPVPVWSPDSGR